MNMPYCLVLFCLFISSCIAPNTDNHQTHHTLNTIELSSKTCLQEVKAASQSKLQTKDFVYKILKQIYTNDQEAREILIPYMQHKNATVYFDKVKKIDLIHTTILKIILKVNKGWVVKSIFGDESDDMAWHIVQHMDDLNYQKKVLKIFLYLSHKGETALKNYAYLYDRIALKENKLQRYGTQLIFDEPTKQYKSYPVMNPSGLNKRRHAVGLGNVESYLKHANSTT